MTEPSPRHVLLFSGHMIDAPGRASVRFPPEAEAAAAMKISEQLDKLAVGPADLAICGGAGGGDLLFAEACRARGVPLEILTAAGIEETLERNGREPPFLVGAFERNNERMLQRSMTWGADRLQFVALWDGQGGDGAGGTAAMVEAVRRQTNLIHVIGTQSLTTC